MQIRVLQGKDARAYHELRLHGLQTNPEAFGSTYERESQFTLTFVSERLTPVRDKFTLGAFDDGGELAGIVTFVRDNGVKTSHKGNIYGMYVKEQARGQGIGKRLMLELIRKAKELDGLEQLNLCVVTGNAQAKQLYLMLGFEVFGLERRALKHNGKYSDEENMVLHTIDQNLR